MGRRVPRHFQKGKTSLSLSETISKDIVFPQTPLSSAIPGESSSRVVRHRPSRIATEQHQVSMTQRSQQHNPAFAATRGGKERREERRSQGRVSQINQTPKNATEAEHDTACARRFFKTISQSVHSTLGSCLPRKRLSLTHDSRDRERGGKTAGREGKRGRCFVLFFRHVRNRARVDGRCRAPSAELRRSRPEEAERNVEGVGRKGPRRGGLTLLGALSARAPLFLKGKGGGGKKKGGRKEERGGRRE